LNRKEIEMLKEQKKQVFIFGIVAILDISLATPVAKAVLDIERISITPTNEYENSVVPSFPPWMFHISVHLVDPDTLHHVNVTPPAGGVAPFTIYEDPIYGYVYDLPIRYSTLADLRVDYPDGNYTFDFYDVSGTLLNSVTLNNSGLSEPSSPVNFTYPSTNGQTGIGTNPTFTWTVSPDAGDALSLWVQDFSSDYEAYIGGLVSMTTLSWTPGPLLPNHEYGLDVSVYTIKDLQPGPAWPTMTVSGDTFAYGIKIEYLNMIDFTTVPIDIAPDTIRTNAKSITCHIWPLDGYDVTEIDLDSIRLKDDIKPSHISVRKKQQMLVVKFPTSGLPPLVQGLLELTVSGELTDGTPFEGTDSVDVIQKGGKSSQMEIGRPWLH
jgi:hypothetical protein